MGSWIGTKYDSVRGRRGFILLSERREHNNNSERSILISNLQTRNNQRLNAFKNLLLVLTHQSRLVSFLDQDASSFVAVKNKHYLMNIYFPLLVLTTL